MNITRNNYEEIFMLYTDNELSAADKAAVEAFIAANPDLAEELAFFQQSKLQPDEKLVFPGKQALVRAETRGEESISMQNYNQFFVLYADDELDNDQKSRVEDFVYRHPQIQAGFELLLQAKMTPDSSIVFGNKEVLYRKEEDDKVVPFRWWRLAAAAMVLLIAGAFWIYQSGKQAPEVLVKNAQPAAPGAAPANSVTVPQKAVQPAVAEEKLAAAAKITAGQQEKNAAAGQSNRKKQKPGGNNTPVAPQAPEQPELLAAATPDKLKASNPPSIKKDNTAGVEVNKELAAARSLPDQPMNILNPGEVSKTKPDWAVSSGADNVEVLNTSVNTKNSMRGFFRKASRLISKKTSLGSDEDNRKGILIGGFEIAVR